MSDVAQPSEKQTTGEVDPKNWDEAVAVTGRPNDVPEDNSTFASRAKRAKEKPAASKVDAPVTAPKKRAARK